VDRSAKDSGQGGIALRLHSPNTDYGIYALQWHAKTPQVYVRPGSFTPPGGPPVIVDPGIFNPATGQIGEYYLVYPENIRTYGSVRQQQSETPTSPAKFRYAAIRRL
jgi:hypothetical protein